MEERLQPPMETGVIARTDLGYLTAGEGEPVVLLHGWGGCKEMWWGTVRALSASYRVFAFDWPGHGSTPLRQGEPVLETLAERALATCAALSLQRFTVVGHSLGGNVAARMALDGPDVVARLALVDAAIDAQYLPVTSRLAAHPRLGKHALRLNRLLCWPLSRLGARVPHEHGGGFLRPLARRQSFLARVEDPVLFEFLVALRSGSLGGRVAQIPQPTLVVSGDRDPMVRPRQAQELARNIPHAHLQLLPGAYHCPMDERPAQFVRALVEFLRAHPTPPDSLSPADSTLQVLA